MSPARLGLAVAALTLAAMLAAEPRLAIAWDEGYTLGRQDRIRAWLKALADPPAFAARWRPPALELVQPDNPPAPPLRRDEIDTRANLFSRRSLDYFWPFARAEPHGHPPLYAILGLLGDLLTPSRAQLPRARLGPIVAFSLTSGLICTFMSRRYGTWPGLASAGAWALQPQLFGHGHYATYDALLTSLWVCATFAFYKAVESPRRNLWAVALGVLLGWAADTKLTGWFLPIPLLTWAALYRSRRGLQAMLIGGLVAVPVALAFNPAYWADPIAGVARFLRSNLTRDRTIPIPVLFLGRVVMTPKASLPWYNTLLLTAIVTPFGMLMLALAGIYRSILRSRSDTFAPLVVIQWAFLLALRALPHTPGHDGVRQFLPAFGMLAIASGLGAAVLVERFPRIGRACILLSIIEGAASIALMMPVPLSYYSPIVVGLPGATRLGMEPTYYWDGLSPEAIAFLNDKTPPGAKVAFATFPTSWIYLQRQGLLKAELLTGGQGSVAWYVLQNRPGAFRPEDKILASSGKPAFVASKFGVPLVWIFPIAEHRRAVYLARQAPSPP